MTGISYDTLNNSAGVLFVSIGLSTWLYAPLASLCGRKISFVFGVLISIAGSIWYARMNRDGDSFGSQVFIGFGEGCSEAQVQLCLSSIFFRHQLGSVITIYVLSYSLGTYLGPLVANYISEASNFRWVGWANTIASVFTLVMVLLFFEEDSFSYHRFRNHTTDAILNYSLAQHGIVSNEDDLTLGFYDKMWGLPKRLALITLPESRDWHSFPEFVKQYFKLLFFNLKCLWFPPVLYAGVVWGIQMALLTFYLTTEDTELYLPPFNYSSEMVALMNIPCIIGSTIGCLYSGALTDYFILWMARRRKGIVESEFRLYFAFLSGIIGSVGLFMFGFGISKALNWRVFYVGLGFIAYLFSSACNLSMLYVIDTYDQLVLETLVAVALISNVIGCIFTFACSPWLSQSGVQNTYIALAVISFALMSLAAPYLYWGKSWRKLTKKTYISMIQARHAKNA
ncbi:DEKNAAC100446 [Brettanomyces naardenensis]|uniref:DEKNAAC100446 n=1 Tax=Brettanomyces naardenensis TaxID=13370 RepID=A0A448YGH6_BRENA|nr:DEKNAAC100446 [Brettanomyces naardenensis]